MQLGNVLARKVSHAPSYIQRRYFPTTMQKILGINGWTLEAQLRYLMRQVRLLPDQGNIVEVGVWQGRSAIAMAEACRGTGKCVFTVDPWTDYLQNGTSVSTLSSEWGVTSLEDNYQAFLANCKRFQVDRWVVTLRSTSLDAARDWANGPVSMLFIDGNHDYGAVVADLEAWTPLVTFGGLICGDDWIWESVRTAVTDFVSGQPGWELHLPCGNTWAFVKTA